MVPCQIDVCRICRVLHQSWINGLPLIHSIDDEDELSCCPSCCGLFHKGQVRDVILVGKIREALRISSLFQKTQPDSHWCEQIHMNIQLPQLHARLAAVIALLNSSTEVSNIPFQTLSTHLEQETNSFDPSWFRQCVKSHMLKLIQKVLSSCLPINATVQSQQCSFDPVSPILCDLVFPSEITQKTVDESLQSIASLSLPNISDKVSTSIGVILDSLINHCDGLESLVALLSNQHQLLPQKIEFRRPNVFLVGCYLKLTHGVSQTPWRIPCQQENSEELLALPCPSVQELLGLVLSPFFFHVDFSSTVEPLDRNECDKDSLLMTVDNISSVSSQVIDLSRLVPRDSVVLSKLSKLIQTFREANEGILDKFILHAAGREDRDVRMIGRGRTFLLEIVSPVLLPPITDTRRLVEAINHHAITACAIRVDETASFQLLQDATFLESSPLLCDGTKWVRRLDVMRKLHALSGDKRKAYRCICWISLLDDVNDEWILQCRLNELSQLVYSKPLTLQQQTPIRVLHRRTLTIREKLIYSISGSVVSTINNTSSNDHGHWVVLELLTQAGTYVKEFCHGDMGRTRPSLGDLLNRTVDIVQLDVTSVDTQDDWWRIHK